MKSEATAPAGLPEKVLRAGSWWGRLGDRSFKYWAVAPALLVVLVLAVYPTLDLVQLSFGDVKVIGRSSVWSFVGLGNLQTMFHDPIAPVALRNTVEFMFVVVAVETAFGLALAIVVSRTGRIGVLYRTLLIVPVLLPPVASATMWRLMLDYNFGVVDQALRTLHLPAPAWIANPRLALPSVMILDVWHWTSLFFLVFLAAVESVPGELLEAARIDGAGEWKLLRHLLLPLLAPTIAGLVALRIIFSFKVFDEVFVLTGGGPGSASQVISVYIYQVFFEQNRTGYGSLLALLTALLVALILLIYQRTLLRGAATVSS